MRFASLVLGVSLSLASVSYASEVKTSEKNVKQISAELRSLRKAGVVLHQKFDGGTLSDCAASNQSLLTRARTLRALVKETDPYYQVDLWAAADAALECVSCRGTAKQCSEIIPELQKVERKISKAREPDRPLSATDKW